MDGPSGADDITRPGWKLFISFLNGASRTERTNRSNSLLTINIDSPFVMPGNVASLTNVLDDIAVLGDLPRATQERLMRDIVSGFLSALAVGRAPDKVTIILLGGTGQGKSKTINKLIGREGFLETGQHESTTKAVQSALIPIVNDGVKLTLALDDTPGLLDTTLADRPKNAVALNRYCQSFTTHRNSTNVDNLTRLLDSIHSNHPSIQLRRDFRNSVFPNAVLLTSTWRDVKKDAHNGPGRYTSALGHAISVLKTSGLYDEERPNVVVVVTRALTDPQAEIDEKFDSRWKKEAGAKRDIIHAIQDTVYPGSNPWPVAFVENGGNKHEFSAYPILPNNEQSHQNLIDGMRILFSQQEVDGDRDLLGLQTLASLVSGSHEGVIKNVHSVGASVSEVEQRAALRRFGGTRNAAVSPTVKALASTILGHTYNPVFTRFSSTLAVGPRIKITITSAESEGFDNVFEQAQFAADMCATNSQLQVNYDIRVASSAERTQRQYVAYKTVAKAKFDSSRSPPVLSEEMARVIGALPPWDETSASTLSSYYAFFDDHGTHVVESAAFGGVVHIKGQTESGLDKEKVAARLQTGLVRQPSSSTEGSQELRFRYKGGRRTGTSLIHGLQRLFNATGPHSSSRLNDWPAVRTRWADELIEDPVFLPSSPQTTYAWLYSLPGLSPEQAGNLMQASRRYLTRPVGDHLDRSANVTSVRAALRHGRRQFWQAIRTRVKLVFR